MAFNSRFTGNGGSSSLGIGQMSGQRLAALLAGPGGALNVANRTGGGGTSMPSARLPEEKESDSGGGMSQLGGLLGMIDKAKGQDKKQDAESVNIRPDPSMFSSLGQSQFGPEFQQAQGNYGMPPMPQGGMPDMPGIGMQPGAQPGMTGMPMPGQGEIPSSMIQQFPWLQQPWQGFGGGFGGFGG